jgi:hypothetical protein
MRQMVLILSLTPEEQVLWDGRAAMVVALNDAEAEVLRGNVNGIDDYLRFVARCLATLRQVLESEGDKEEQIRKTLTMMLDPARVAVELSDGVRELLGRAVFVGPQTKKGPMQ